MTTHDTQPQHDEIDAMWTMLTNSSGATGDLLTAVLTLTRTVNALLRHVDELQGGVNQLKAKVFEKMNAPEYPATCDQCGVEGTNASMEEHECNESHSLKSLSALLKDPSYMTLPRARQIAIKHAHWNATTLPNNEFSLSWQDTKVLLDAHATLIEQRERLLRLLRPVTSPTSCYCAVMKSEKCWHCEARELIATIEREREVKSNTSGEAGSERG